MPERVGPGTPGPQPKSPKWGKRRAAIIVSSAAALLGGGTFVADACLCLTPGAQPVSPGGGTPERANLWVDGSGTCTRSASLAEYDSATACVDLDDAHDAASGGDTVLIKTGSYSAVVDGFHSRSSYVDFRPGEGQTCSVSSSIQVQAQYVRITSCQMTNNDNGVYIEPLTGDGSDGYQDWPNHVEIIDFGEAGEGWTSMLRGDDLLLQDGSLGDHDICTRDEDILRSWEARFDSNGDGTHDSIRQPERVVVDGVTLHDMTASVAEGPATCGLSFAAEPHPDCFQGLGAGELTIRNSIFINCYDGNFIGRPFQGGNVGPYTFENNYFGGSNSGEFAYNVSAGNQVDDSGRCESPLIFRNNTVAAGSFGTTCNGTTWEVTGNLFTDEITCSFAGGSGTSAYNVRPGTTCGTNGTACTASLEADGYHLTVGDTCAIGAGDPSDFPTDDIDGDVRSSPPDAGADER